MVISILNEQLVMGKNQKTLCGVQNVLETNKNSNLKYFVMKLFIKLRTNFKSIHNENDLFYKKLSIELIESPVTRGNAHSFNSKAIDDKNSYLLDKLSLRTAIMSFAILLIAACYLFSKRLSKVFDTKFGLVDHLSTEPIGITLTGN